MVKVKQNQNFWSVLYDIKNTSSHEFKLFLDWNKMFISAFSNFLFNHISTGPFKMSYCFKIKNQGFYKEVIFLAWNFLLKMSKKNVSAPLMDVTLPYSKFDTFASKICSLHQNSIYQCWYSTLSPLKSVVLKFKLHRAPYS